MTISPFAPKPHTPFQWEKLEDVDSLQNKIHYLKMNCRKGGINLKFRDPQVSYLEGILGRGDRRICSVIYSAWKKGARLDGWSEHFNYQYWMEAFAEQGIEPGRYAAEKDPELPLPWDHVDKGIRKERLKKERNRAHALGEESSVDEQRSAEPRIGTGELKMADFGVSQKLQNAMVPSQDSSRESDVSYGRKKKKITISPGIKVARSRVRLKWSKSEEVRFTSHLDVGRTFERAIRRSGIPIAYTEGFHPHQKVAFGPPLPLGFVSCAEYLDIQLTEPYTSATFTRLNRALPPGFKFLAGKPILGKSDSLSFIVNLASYEVGLELTLDQTKELIRSTLERTNLLVKRVTRQQQIMDVEIRRFISKLDCELADDRVILKMDLRLGTEGYARPGEILVYGFGLTEKEVAGLLFERTGLFILENQRILTPMEVI